MEPKAFEQLQMPIVIKKLHLVGWVRRPTALVWLFLEIWYMHILLYMMWQKWNVREKNSVRITKCSYQLWYSNYWESKCSKSITQFLNYMRIITINHKTSHCIFERKKDCVWILYCFVIRENRDNIMCDGIRRFKRFKMKTTINVRLF